MQTIRENSEQWGANIGGNEGSVMRELENESASASEQKRPRTANYHKDGVANDKGPQPWPMATTSGKKAVGIHAGGEKKGLK